MIIQCEACKTKFRVGDDKVKPPGIKVRCSKCGEVFFFEYSLHEDHGHEAQPENPLTEVPNSAETPDTDVIRENVLDDVPAGTETDPEPEQISFNPPEPEDDLIKIENEPPQEAAGDLQVEKITPEENNLDSESPPDEKQNADGTFLNLEIDHLDDMVKEQGVEAQADQFAASEESTQAPEPSVSEPPKEKPGNEFKSPNLSLDQDVLEQTYSKGTVASSSDVQQPAYAAAKKASTVRRYPRGKRDGGGFIRKLVTWVLSLLLICALFFVSMFLLNETKIYPNDYFSRFDSFAKKYYSGGSSLDLKKNIRIKGDKGSWYSSKYGQVFVVAGEAVNISTTPINYLKLRVYYVSDGTNIFIQELYAGNTLSRREIKNSSFNSLQAKLNRKNGDISYDDANNLDGLNFDIQPGEVIPFYSIFPAKEKILGLKYRVEVVDYDSAEISENP